MKPYTSTARLLVRMLSPALLILLAIPLWASLGDTSASVLKDQAQWKGTLSSVDNQTYVLHEITMASGAKVREYVSPGGAVFGIAWDGQFPPNFEQLLGPYYQQLQQAIAEQKAAQQASELQAGNQRQDGAAVRSRSKPLAWCSRKADTYAASTA